MIYDYFKLAFTSLSHRRLRSWLTMIGIFIGIASIIALIGLGEGLRNAITSQFNFLGTDILTIQASGLNIGPPGSGATTPLKDNLVVGLRKINGVEAAINRYIEAGTIDFNDRQNIGYVVSMPSGQDRRTIEESGNLKIFQGRLLKDGDNNGIVLGNDFSKDTTFGKGIKVSDRIQVNGKLFTVIGILEKKGSFIFDSAIYMNEKPLLDLFGDTGNTDAIYVKVRDVNNIASVQANVEKFLRKERNVKKGQEDFTVQTPQKMLESLNSAVFAVQLFVYIIALVSLVVGGIGIMNTMYTAVLERKKEIGIMKAIGARNSAIFILFFIESGFLGMIGGLIGVILGAGIAYGIAGLGSLVLGSDLIQASVSVYIMSGALIFSFLLGTFFGVIPALQAAKLQPVEALKSK
jgi:putative ABC transport system permease protein